MAASDIKKAAFAGTADQVFSSVSNGLVLYALAVVTDVGEFGRLSVIFTVVAAGVGLLRGSLGTPLLLAADRGADEVRSQGRYAVVPAFVTGLVVGAVIVIYGAIEGSPAIVVVGAGAPLLMTQDVMRYVAIGAGQAMTAAVWDGLWCFGSLLLLVLTWVSVDAAGPTELALGWVLLGAVACFGLAASLRLRPTFDGVLPWMRTDWRHRLRFGLDAGLEQVGVLCVLVISAAVIGNSAAGSLRGAVALLAPFAILSAAIPLVIIPDSRKRGRAGHQTWSVLVRIAALTGGVVLAFGAVIFVLPEQVGRMVLGDTFAGARPVLGIMAFEYAMGAFVFAIATYLRALKRSTELVTLKVVQTVLSIAAATAAALIFGSSVAVAAALTVATAAVVLGALSILRPWQKVDDVAVDDLEQANVEGYGVDPAMPGLDTVPIDGHRTGWPK